jgi:hypothetical protein
VYNLKLLQNKRTAVMDLKKERFETEDRKTLLDSFQLVGIR